MMSFFELSFRNGFHPNAPADFQHIKQYALPQIFICISLFIGFGKNLNGQTTDLNNSDIVLKNNPIMTNCKVFILMQLIKLHHRIKMTFLKISRIIILQFLMLKNLYKLLILHCLPHK